MQISCLFAQVLRYFHVCHKTQPFVRVLCRNLQGSPSLELAISPLPEGRCLLQRCTSVQSAGLRGEETRRVRILLRFLSDNQKKL